MKIDILCSSPNHPIYHHLKLWAKKCSVKHSVKLFNSKFDLNGGDILFLISCSEIINADDRGKYTKALVVHASDLPLGRGWSPHIWQIVEGKTDIVVSLLEAEDKVDTGDIWHKLKINIPEHYLYDEINTALFNAEMELMDFAIDNFETIVPVPQSADASTSYYKKRTPADSEISIHKKIEDQFDIIRVSDPNRFPAFFYHLGNKYKLTVEKIKDE